MIDFAELLLRAYELWRDNPRCSRTTRTASVTCSSTSSRTRTPSQYGWMKLVAGAQGAPSWWATTTSRSIAGAALEWRTSRSSAGISRPRSSIRLEQNYRSTSSILDAANALISNNNGRLGKNLWTNGSKGDPIRLYAAFNERDEAEFIVQRIKDWSNTGGRAA